MRMARPSCLVLLAHLIWMALDFALASAGNSNAARIAMIAMTTSSSMRVNAPFVRIRCRELKLSRFVILTNLEVLFRSTSGKENGTGAGCAVQGHHQAKH